eukprot:scaffold7330_cov146-Cylindrotheca_fusiformis.AAC.11
MPSRQLFELIVFNKRSHDYELRAHVASRITTLDSNKYKDIWGIFSSFPLRAIRAHVSCGITSDDSTLNTETSGVFSAVDSTTVRASRSRGITNHDSTLNTKTSGNVRSLQKEAYMYPPEQFQIVVYGTFNAGTASSKLKKFRFFKSISMFVFVRQN